jgi:hypothetical protein
VTMSGTGQENFDFQVPVGEVFVIQHVSVLMALPPGGERARRGRATYRSSLNRRRKSPSTSRSSGSPASSTGTTSSWQTKT